MEHLIILPDLPGGAAVVLRWLAEPGAPLEAGAPLLIARTDRVEAALPAPAAGRLGEILIATSARVEPGQALARLLPPDRAQPAPPTRITPLARRIAAAHGIDLSGLSGSGADERIVAEDVRRIVGATHSPLPIPVATAMVEFDAGPALARGAGLEACVAAAATELLPHHRALNARWTADGLLLCRRLHLAIARPAGAGLAWALVRDAGDLTLRGLARALAAPADPGDLHEASFALVSMAEGAIWHSAPHLPAGNVAALGIGGPRSRPVASDETIVMRPIAALSLSYDARALDHAQAAAFLRELRAHLENL